MMGWVADGSRELSESPPRPVTVLVRRGVTWLQRLLLGQEFEASSVVSIMVTNVQPGFTTAPIVGLLGGLIPRVAVAHAVREPSMKSAFRHSARVHTSIVRLLCGDSTRDLSAPKMIDHHAGVVRSTGVSRGVARDTATDAASRCLYPADRVFGYCNCCKNTRSVWEQEQGASRRCLPPIQLIRRRHDRPCSYFHAPVAHNQI